mmetsp:Transcript_7019/g.12298  ORF Transcript_7019/g.12298 Transcript_7019/m.12298 type:complete len:94 (-) Transcript_7019:1358-1639(-)
MVPYFAHHQEKSTPLREDKKLTECIGLQSDPSRHRQILQLTGGFRLISLEVFPLLSPVNTAKQGHCGNSPTYRCHQGLQEENENRSGIRFPDT